MKRFIFIAAAALLCMAACTKNEIRPVDVQNEITFMTANYATKAGIVGTVFPNTETFGAYAWAAGTTGTYFMNDETISYVTADNAWKPSTTYYWPKNTTVDFICYYPKPATGLTIAANQIKWTDYDVESTPADLMYADKAVGYNGNTDEISDGTNTFQGVPVIFRHALAKLKVDLALSYKHKEEADGTVTDWTVKLNSFRLLGMYKKGGIQLDLATTPTTGIVPWVPVQDANGFKVWTNDGSECAATERVASPLDLVPGTDYNMIPETFILPQALAAGQQRILLNVTIVTKRNGADFLTETFDIPVNLYLASLPAWEMNHVITYKLTLNPTAGNGNGGSPIDPSNPVDPDDPNLKDVTITFDPAVDGWANVGVVTALNI